MKTIKNNVRYSVAIFMLFSISMVGCSKSDDPEADKSVGDQAVAIATGPEGSNLTVTYEDGTTEKMLGDQIFGWTHNELLGKSYLEVLIIATDKGSMYIDMNMPGRFNFYDILEQSHELRPIRLRLENTADLGEVYPELFFPFPSSEFESLGNFNGRVTFERDVASALRTYDLVGEVDVEKSGVKIQGYFWVEKVDEY